jgi:hypothetical protein
MSSAFRVVLSHFVALSVSVAGVLSAVACAYFREQVTAGVRWMFAPVANGLPWNRTGVPHPSAEPELFSLFTIAQLRFFERDGSQASYEKTSDYEVRSAYLSEYREGVTTEGTASHFATAIGQITATAKEHGFYVSRIDLGNLLKRGSRFQNTYSVQLADSFLKSEEHWTQEVAVPCEHLTIRVIFPDARPPSLLRCKLLSGLNETQLPTSARLMPLRGSLTAIWELPRPRLGEIYKLEWTW